MKLMRLIRLMLGVILIAIITLSCKDDNEPTQDYAGKWITEKPVAVTTGYISIKYYLELTNYKFRETFIRPARTSYTTGDQLSMEGTVLASGNILKLVVHKLSVSKYDPVASEPYETFTFEDQNFGFEFEGIGMSTSNHQVEYEIVDNQLILKVDYNRDDIYSENEKSAYTKQ